MTAETQKILFVDNHQNYIDSICEGLSILFENRRDFRCVYSCDEALDLARDKRVLQIFLDISFGGEPLGIEVCKQIKRSYSFKWVGMYTNFFKNTNYFDMAREAKCDEFLGKITDPELNLMVLKCIITVNDLAGIRDLEYKEAHKILIGILNEIGLTVSRLRKKREEHINIYKVLTYGLKAFDLIYDAVNSGYCEERDALRLHYGYWELLVDHARTELVIRRPELRYLLNPITGGGLWR